MARTQFSVVAGFALTVNKAQGLTMKESMVIHPHGWKSYRPAPKHGLPFVAFTRSESFHMTAFCNLPPWDDFLRGSRSDLLRMRQEFGERLEGMHRRTMARCSQLSTEEDEDAAYEDWLVEQARRSNKKRKLEKHGVTCPECDAAWGRNRC